MGYVGDGLTDRDRAVHEQFKLDGRGNARAQGDDAGDVRRIGGLADAAEDHFVDLGRVDAGFRQQRGHRVAAEFDRVERGELRSGAQEGRPVEPLEEGIEPEAVEA